MARTGCAVVARRAKPANEIGVKGRPKMSINMATSFAFAGISPCSTLTV